MASRGSRSLSPQGFATLGAEGRLLTRWAGRGGAGRAGAAPLRGGGQGGVAPFFFEEGWTCARASAAVWTCAARACGGRALIIKENKNICIAEQSHLTMQ